MRLQDRTRTCRHVFVDTSVYEAVAFQVEARTLTALLVRAQSKRVALHITTVVMREVERRIRESVRVVVTEHKRFIGKAGVVRGLLPQQLLDGLDEERLVHQVWSRFKEFLLACEATTHSLSNVEAESVMDLHFAGSPPFEMTGKKKNEFRDAFSLAALSLWGSSNDETVDVLSLDGDMRNACGTTFYNLRWGGDLATFLDALVREDRNADEIISRLPATRPALEAALETAFEEGTFTLDDLEGDICAVEVLSIEIEDVFVFAATETAGELEVHARIKYLAHVVYKDYTNASYDREDHVYFGVESRALSIKDEARASATINVTLARAEAALQVGDCSLAGSFGVRLRVHDDHGLARGGKR